MASSAAFNPIRTWEVLIRSGSRMNPSPLEEFDCGSQSTSRTGTSAAASEAARLMAVVVLPTPPFWCATAMILPMGDVFQRREYPNRFRLGNAAFWCKGRVFLGISFAPADCSTWNTYQTPKAIPSLDECSTWNIRILATKTCEIPLCFPTCSLRQCKRPILQLVL